MTNTDAKIMREAGSEWIEWHGGKCPVPSYTHVEVRWYSDNDLLTDAGKAVSFDWSTNGSPRDPSSGDIVAYRVVNP